MTLALALASLFVVVAVVEWRVWRRLEPHLLHHGESAYHPLARASWDFLGADEVDPEARTLWTAYRVIEMVRIALWIPGGFSLLYLLTEFLGRPTGQ